MLAEHRDQASEVLMRTLLSVRLPPDARAPRLARRALRGLHTDGGGDPFIMQLLVSELVTNSLKHASLEPSDHIGLDIRDAGDYLRVEVRDPGARYADALSGWTSGAASGSAAEDQVREEGYGFLLVRRESSRSGVGWDEGTLAWFEIECWPTLGVAGGVSRIR